MMKEEWKTRPRTGKWTFAGGDVGQEYAKLLCPLGYRREYMVIWGPNGRTDKYYLDFALPEAKVDVELDGPYHQSSNDKVRDERLRALGWRIIRIRHTFEGA